MLMQTYLHLVHVHQATVNTDEPVWKQAGEKQHGKRDRDRSYSKKEKKYVHVLLLGVWDVLWNT